MNYFIVLSPNKDRSFGVFLYSNNQGNWYFSTECEDSSTEKIFTRYTSMYLICQIIRKSTFQTQIALSTTQEQYILISEALHNMILLMQFLQEIRKLVLIHYLSHLNYFASHLKTIWELWNYHTHKRYGLAPKTSTKCTIILRVCSEW